MNPIMRHIAAASLLLFSYEAVADLSGNWHGTLSAAQYNPIELVFRVLKNTSDDSAGYQASLDIPAQFRLGLPVSSVRVSEKNLTFRLPDIQAEFYGVLVYADDGVTVLAIDGDWSQSGEYVPLRLERRD
jgi:hypothetical protein